MIHNGWTFMLKEKRAILGVQIQTKERERNRMRRSKRERRGKCRLSYWRVSIHFVLGRHLQSCKRHQSFQLCTRHTFQSLYQRGWKGFEFVLLRKSIWNWMKRNWNSRGNSHRVIKTLSREFLRDNLKQTTENVWLFILVFIAIRPIRGSVVLEKIQSFLLEWRLAEEISGKRVTCRFLFPLKVRRAVKPTVSPVQSVEQLYDFHRLDAAGQNRELHDVGEENGHRVKVLGWNHNAHHQFVRHAFGKQLEQQDLWLLLLLLKCFRKLRFEVSGAKFHVLMKRRERLCVLNFKAFDF